MSDFDRLEPEVKARLIRFLERNGEIPEDTGQSAALHSIAISLKRLADLAEEFVSRERL